MRARSNRKAVVWGLFIGLLVLVLAVRAYLPTYVKNAVNEKFSDLGDYKGHVEDVDLHLWRAGISFHDLEIVKKNSAVKAKLFHVESIDAMLLWPALLRLKLVAQIDLYKPVVNIVDAKDPDKQQTGAFKAKNLPPPPDEPGARGEEEKIAGWQDTIAALYPLRIDRFTIHNGKAHFRNFEADPQVNVYASDIDLAIRNISNSDGVDKMLISDLDLKAKVMGQAQLAVKSEFNALTKEPLFDLNGKMQKFDLKTLNDFTRHYAKFDFKAGTAELVTEFAMRDGKVKGYLKPLVHGIDVFDWEQDVKQDNDNPLKAFWESLVGGASQIVEHQKKEQIGMVVPIEADTAGTDVNIYTVMVTTFRNAFVKALVPRYENNININSPKEVGTKENKKS